MLRRLKGPKTFWMIKLGLPKGFLSSKNIVGQSQAYISFSEIEIGIGILIQIPSPYGRG
jgi:hypothetical protein